MLDKVSAENRWQLSIKIIQREANNEITLKSIEYQKTVLIIYIDWSYTLRLLTSLRQRKGASSFQKLKESHKERAILREAVIVRDSANPDFCLLPGILIGWQEVINFREPNGLVHKDQPLRVQIIVERVESWCEGEKWRLPFRIVFVAVICFLKMRLCYSYFATSTFLHNT